jgi:Flp pilus assembly protein TadG
LSFDIGSVVTEKRMMATNPSSRHLIPGENVMSPTDTIGRRRTKSRNDKGAILFIVAACLVVLLGFMGLAIDLGHAYSNKSLLQNMADACALAGGSALNSAPQGIALAETRARDSANNLANKTEFNGKAVSIPASAVTFSASLNGPWLARAAAEAVAVAPTIRYVKVNVPPQATEVVFAKVIPGIPASLSFGAEAVAGQLPLQQVCRGMDPFSPVRRDIGPFADNPVQGLPGDFGYVRGQSYELRLSPGNSGKNCGQQGIPGSVTGNFGFADVSGCGNGTSCLVDSIVNGSVEKCIGAGPTVGAVPGDRGSTILGALQNRFDQDNDLALRESYDAFEDDYLTNTIVVSNGRQPYRRMLRVAFNDGVIPNGSGTYNIQGFGCFFMDARPIVHPPSSALCLMFVGACSESGAPAPGAGAPSITRLVLFK